MKQSENGTKKATRQCWECLKRRLVCDHTLPCCIKCQKAGKECSGYDDQKPLQWLEPGKVNSRRRKKNTQPKIYTVPAVEKYYNFPDYDSSSTESTIFSDVDLENRESIGLQTTFTDWRPGSQAYWGYSAADHYDRVQDFALKLAADLEVVDRLLASGGRAKIEEIVSKRMHKEAAKLLHWEKQPLKKLESVLCIMRTQALPHYSYLSNETSEVVQAVSYYNLRIFPEISKSAELAPNPAIILFPPHSLHLLPPAVHHTLVCQSLNHFNQRLPSGQASAIVNSNRAKIYHHRGAAIRALSEYIANDKTRCSDLTIVSILAFMSMDLQNAAFEAWRTHAQGMHKLVKMRGGFKRLIEQSPHLDTTLVLYILIIAVGNTTSPSWDQMDINSTIEENIDNIADVYSLFFPYTLCPPELFFELLRINDLRSKASALWMLGEADPKHALQAQHLLSRIEAFVPEDWAQPGKYFDEWLVIGTMYRAAIALYCIVSLQSLNVLPSTLEMSTIRTLHADQLLVSLRAALLFPRVKRFVVWPLVVVGVEAAYRGEGTRTWIEASLTDAGHLLGTRCPGQAKTVLRRYWERGQYGWDECFQQPYIFIT